LLKSIEPQRKVKTWYQSKFSIIRFY